MGKRSPRYAIQVGISNSDVKQVLIANYLRNSGNIAGQSMDAIAGYWYSIAVSEQENFSDTEIQLALLKSLHGLSSQIRFLLNYHRIKDGVELPSECLATLGLFFGWTEQSPVSSTSQVNGQTARPVTTEYIGNSPTLPGVQTQTFQEDEDEEDEYEILGTPITYSPEVMKILSGEGE